MAAVAGDLVLRQRFTTVDDWLIQTGLFVVGIFGGTAALGFVGIFYGPIVLGTLKALVEVYTREEVGWEPVESAESEEVEAVENVEAPSPETPGSEGPDETGSAPD